MATLLERAKGSELDIVAGLGAPPNMIQLLSSHVQQIGSLRFTYNLWNDVLQFFEVNSGPLPFLHTLEIFTYRRDVTPREPPPSFYNGAVNLEKLVFNSEMVQSWGKFTFPNLTTCEIVARAVEGVDGSHLLDFLIASPRLQAIKMEIHSGIHLRHIPQGMVAILPHAETFTLFVINAAHIYDLAAHISCPRATYTHLMQELPEGYVMPEVEMFPAQSPLWSTIVHQYTRSPVEEVTRQASVCLRASPLIPSPSGVPTHLCLPYISMFPRAKTSGASTMNRWTTWRFLKLV